MRGIFQNSPGVTRCRIEWGTRCAYSQFKIMKFSPVILFVQQCNIFGIIDLTWEVSDWPRTMMPYTNGFLPWRGTHSFLSRSSSSIRTNNNKIASSGGIYVCQIWRFPLVIARFFHSVGCMWRCTTKYTGPNKSADLSIERLDNCLSI